MSPGPPPATAGPVLWKEGSPYIGGDLPQGWTPARKPVANGTVAIEPLADGGGLVYRIAIAGSELYPWRFDPAQPLRLSPLVNDDDGQGRLGWLEWGGGIGGETDPGPMAFTIAMGVHSGPCRISLDVGL